MTPNLLMLGRKNWLPSKVILGTDGTSTGEAVTSYSEYVDSLKDHMQRAHDVARDIWVKRLMMLREV